MFDVFDNYEHWTEDGYEIRQPDGRVRHLTDITGDKAIDFLRTHLQPAVLSLRQFQRAARPGQRSAPLHLAGN